MKYIEYFIFSLMFSFSSLFYISQTSGDQFILSTSGENAVMSNGHQISWTIGEMVTLTGELSNETYTQGFHQPNIDVTIIEDRQVDYNINIYPNPATDFVMIKLDNYDNGDQFKLIDAAGKIILDRSIKSNEILIPFQSYSTGVYILMFTNRHNEKLKTYKIQKSH